MEGLVTFLLFAGLFYFMMRFGCGAHAVHGHGGGGHGGHAGHAGQADGASHAGAPAIDPVCGMEVGPDQGYTVTHANRVYHFCSRACLDKFESNPDQYASVPGGVQ